VDGQTIARRSRELRALADAKNHAFRQAMAGDVRDVLVLEQRDRTTGALVGLTGKYVEVTFEGGDELMRTMTRIRITGVDQGGTRGELAAVRARALPAHRAVGEASEGAVAPQACLWSAPSDL
jgi:tRNA A37 methylthiotransferase MiaB